MNNKTHILKNILRTWVVIVAAAVTLTAHAAMKTSGVVNINTATVTQLEMLPGIGAAKAQAIVDQRQQKPFAKKEDLLLVKGIGEAMLAKISPHIAVQGESTIKEEKIVPAK